MGTKFAGVWLRSRGAEPRSLRSEPGPAGVRRRHGGALLVLVVAASSFMVGPTAETAIGSPRGASQEDSWPVLYRRPAAPRVGPVTEQGPSGALAGPTVDLRAVGDLMFGRGVAETARRRGADYPLSRVHGLLAGDIAVGNLESPLTSRVSTRAGPYRLPAPPQFAEILRGSSFQAVSMANNHALDAGAPGLADSTTALNRAGVVALGVGTNAADARRPARLDVAGLRMALLGVNDVHDPADAGAESWQRAWLDQRFLREVSKARGQADVVVVLVHWGEEYAQAPSPRQRAWGRKLVDAGADVVLGSHPHVLQTVETRVAGDGRTAIVAYSLGNFVFDQDFSRETTTSAVLRLVLDSQGVAMASFAPVEMAQGRVRPLPLDGPDADRIRSRLAGAPP